MPEYVEEVELTQSGMHAIFKRMGYEDITSGSIYNGNPTIVVDKLNEQGFMPVLTGVGPKQTYGHWIMLLKGKEDNQYFLFDPLGQASGKGYQSILAKQLPPTATLTVIPNEPGLNKGLCGYWIASAGLRARKKLIGEHPPTPEILGREISTEMQGELEDRGYTKITGWLRAVAHKFPDGDVQPDATALRRATEAGLNIGNPVPAFTKKKEKAPETSQIASPESNTPPMLSVSSNLLAMDGDVRSTVNYVHKEYLRHSYPGPLKNPKNPSEGRLPPNEGDQRMPHGLAHTVRTMACAEVMVEEARKARLRGEKLGTAKDGRSLADVTPEELKKILIAQAFFVVGRDDERSGYDDKHKRDFYEEYHDQSEIAFRKYVKDHKLIGTVFKDQKEVDHYAAIVKDRPNNWDGTPAHVLIHQGHMVDLMRVKAPQEVVVEKAFKTLKGVVGARGAEAVLKAHRDFFFATGAVVPLFNPQAIEDPSKGGPYENPYNGEKYAVEKGKIPTSKKDLRLVDSKNPLKKNEEYLKIKDYYSLPEVQEEFPGCKTYLEASSYYLPTSFATKCEQDPKACLGAIQQVRTQMEPVKRAIQTETKKERRQANIDEIAAARIIKQIMANPKVIHDDHVFLNGQKLEEKFFRELLAKCDMAIVGSLLSDTDISNVDTLMQQETNTLFRATGENPVPTPIGEKWAIRSKARRWSSVEEIKYDLVSQMQDDPWYYSRVNAIAQARDSGSTFKEVLITTLMTPLTSKALVDTHGRAPSPKILYRGLGFQEGFKKQIIGQANNIIANTTENLFTDLSPQVFMQIKLNDLSKISARTNASNSVNIEVPRTIFDSNTIFEISDPQGLLQSKQVGTHKSDSEDEFSFYLPEDVVLLPTNVIPDGKTSKGEDRHILSFIAIRSPDFFPQHKSGFASELFIKMQSEQVTELVHVVMKEADNDLHNKLMSLQVKMDREIHLPIRGGVLERLGHYFSGRDDKKISQERKDFLQNQARPAIRNCSMAFNMSNMEDLQNALNGLPTREQLSRFSSDNAKAFRRDIEELRAIIRKKMALDNVIPQLDQCKDSLDNGSKIDDALEALNTAQSEMSKLKGIKDGRVLALTQELSENLQSLQKAVVTPLVSEKIKERYQSLITYMTQKVVDYEKLTHASVAELDKAKSNFALIQRELDVLIDQKTRMHEGPGDADVSDIEALRGRINDVQPKLIPALLDNITKQYDEIEKCNKKDPKSRSEINAVAPLVHNCLEAIEFLRTERTKLDSLADVSDLETLKGQVQTTNKALFDTIVSFATNKYGTDEVQAFAEYRSISGLLEKALDKSYVLNKKIALVETKPKDRTFAEINFKAATMKDCVEAIESERAERIKTNSSADVSDLDGLKGRIDVVRKESFATLLILTQTKSERQDKTRNEDVEKYLGVLEDLEKTLDPTWVIGKKIETLLEHNPGTNSRTYYELEFKIAIMTECLEAIELQRQERIKAHGTEDGEPDMSDLVVLKGRIQAVADNDVAEVYLNDIKSRVGKMKDIAKIEEDSKIVASNFEKVATLQTLLGDSVKAKQQKEKMEEYQTEFTKKQEEVYPQLTQLRFKVEAFVMQLRDVCDLHHHNLSEARKVELGNQKPSLTGALGGFIGAAKGKVGELLKQEKELSTFKTEFNNDKKTVDDLVKFLAGLEDAAELQAKLGISEENAESLFKLLKTLDVKTIVSSEIEERSRLIDELSTQIGYQPVPFLPSVQDVVINKPEEVGDGIRI